MKITGDKVKCTCRGCPVPWVVRVSYDGLVSELTDLVSLWLTCNTGADQRWRVDRTVQETTADRQLHVSPVCHADPRCPPTLSVCIHCAQIAIMPMRLPSQLHPVNGSLTVRDHDVFSFVDSNAWMLGCCRPDLCTLCVQAISLLATPFSDLVQLEKTRQKMVAEEPSQVRICVVTRFCTCAEQPVRTIMRHSMASRLFANGRYSLHGTLFLLGCKGSYIIEKKAALNVNRLHMMTAAEGASLLAGAVPEGHAESPLAKPGAAPAAGRRA